MVERKQKYMSIWGVMGLCLGLLGLPVPVSARPTPASLKKGTSLLKQGKLKQALPWLEKGCRKRESAHACWLWYQTMVATKAMPADMVQRDILWGKHLRAVRTACRLRGLGSGDGCAVWAKMLRAGRGTPKKPKQAQRLLRRACWGGRKVMPSGLACYKLLEERANAWKTKKRSSKKKAKQQRWPRRIRRLQKRTLRLLRPGCQRLGGLHCYLLAYLTFEGKWLPQQRRRSATLFQRACDTHHADGCDFLALMYGGALGVRKDFARARRLHARACQLMSVDGCTHVGGMAFRGLGGVVNVLKARRLYRKACDWRGAQACLLLGEMVIRGEGGDRNVKGAFALFQRSCGFGNKEACKRVKMMSKILGIGKPTKAR